MIWRTWLPMTAAIAVNGCVATQSDRVSTASEELSVFDWSADSIMGWHTESGSGPAVAGANGVALSVYPQGYVDDHYTYLYWKIALSSASYAWPLEPTLMYPHASSTAHPTLVAFNGFFYVFYASGVDQYYARFNPSTRQWTGSALLPFISNGAVAAVPFNGSLALVRSDPSNDQLYLRWMTTDESFSTEQAISYSTFATDPCAVVSGPPLELTTAGPAAPAPAVAPIDLVSIGINYSEFSASTVALATAGNCLYMAHLDGTSSTLVYNTYSHGSWGAKRTITSGPGGAAQTSAAQPAIASLAGTLHLVHIGPGSSYDNIYWSTLSGGSWTAPIGIPNHQSYLTPALASLGDRLTMLHMGSSAPEPGGSTNLWTSTYLPH